MNSQEKIFSVVSKIKDVKEITASTEPCLIREVDWVDEVRNDADLILKKLEVDHKVLTFTKAPYDSYQDFGQEFELFQYEVIVNNDFDDLYSKLRSTHNISVANLEISNFLLVLGVLLRLFMTILQMSLRRDSRNLMTA